MRRRRSCEHDVRPEAVASPHRPVDGGIASGRQIVHRRVAGHIERRDRRAVGDEYGVVGRREREDVLRRAPRIAKPVDPAWPAAVPQGRDHRRIHLGSLQHKHQSGRGAGDGTGQTVVKADAAEPADPATGADEVDGRDPAAESFQRAPAQAGVGVQRVIERADQKHAGIGETVGHKTQTSERVLDYNPASGFGDEDGLLITELEVVQAAVQATRAEQLVVCAALDDPAGVEHDDLVRVPHGGEPVRDDQHRAVRHQPVDRLLDQPLRLRVQRARGLVENEDRGIPQQRPCDGDPLPLAAREPRAALAQQGLVALRQLAR